MSNRATRNRDMERLDGKRFNMDKFLTILSFAILIVVVIIPMVMIVYSTFFEDGRFDISLFTDIILDPANIGAMQNTVVIALLVTVLGTLVGLFFAWLLGRSDIPLKGLMRSMFTIPYMFPPFFGAMAWELLLSPRSGYLNKWLMATLGLATAPFNINSIGGIVFVEMSYYFPFVFMQVVSALERMDPTLEESARIAGARQWYVIRKITMPLVLPATSAGALLILTSSLSHFGVPAILGFSKKIYTLPTRIYQLIARASGSFQGIREGAALSILLVIVVMLALWLQRSVLRSGSYDIIKGKSMRPMLIKLRGAKIPMLILSISSLTLIVVVPLVMIILVGLLKAYGLPLTPENMTLANFAKLFNNKMVSDSLRNSLFLSVSAGIIAMFLGVMVAYVINKIKPRGKVALEIISILPYSIPGIVLAIGVILAWSGTLGVNLYNTLWIILIAYIARYVAFSMKSASASLQQVHYSLEEAARSSGATQFESLTDVTLPLIRPAMISGFFLIFLPAMRELTTSVLLYGPYTRTLGVAIYSLRSDGYIVEASALASVTILLIIVCNAVVNAIVKDRRKV
ncbi:MAG: iron ABC transporter permease [Eubacteriales bacterium]|nr:iron ABC transporter permease [Eubacteriales bacterium]MDD4710602.1 iron ABC transporter permease [Eubacteriales bacterium]